MARRLEVLIVDDEPDQRAALKETLQAHGIHVAEASSGRQALSYLLACDTEPAMILLDLKMPDMDGNKLLELLWSYRRLSSIPVVALSATSPQQLPLTRPVARRLVKPVNEKVLLRTLGEVSGRLEPAS